MELRRLRLLRELADRGTVTAVAKALDYTPSAVSQQLRALRVEAGVPLIEPAGRGVRLTDAGRALVARADEVLAAVDRMEAELDGFRSAPLGAVRLAMFPSGAQLVLPGLLRRLAAQPRLRIEFRDVDMSPAGVPALLADFDVVVAHRDDHAPPLDAERAEIVGLYREPLDVALPPGHRLAAAERVELSELAGEPWIGVDVGLPVDDVLRSLAIRTGTRPEVVQRVNDFRITEALVAAGHGVALLPRFAAANPNLVLRPLAGVRAGRNVEAVVRRGSAGRPAIGAVLDALRAETADLAT
ncbi:LysR family transcriptional regulator [Saccharopolyspora sp. MS10]|uniref:LysR family transcriptional regulator n=1 Tax=Saccharopolyspora sp. MS10 TaxID=3385973 RepID=UPI0039A15F4B